MTAAAPRPVAVVPAAGAARRMGRDKLALPWRRPGGAETTVLGATVAALLAGGAARVVVVGPPGGPEGDDPRLGRPVDPRVTTVLNPDPSRGMLSSIVAGLEHLAGLRRSAGPAAPDRPLLVAPADLPALSPATVAAVAAALAAGALLALPRHRASGRRGHPLGIAAPLLAEIPGLDPAIGLRQLLDRHGEAIVELPVEDPGCISDVDTPEDYRKLTEGGRDF